MQPDALQAWGTAPLLPSASRAQAKMPLFLNLRTMPGRTASRGGQRGWAGSHVFWASTPHLQTGAKGIRPLSLRESAPGVLPGPCPRVGTNPPPTGMTEAHGSHGCPSQELFQDPGHLAPQTHSPFTPQAPRTSPPGEAPTCPAPMPCCWPLPLLRAPLSRKGLVCAAEGVHLAGPGAQLSRRGGRVRVMNLALVLLSTWHNLEQDPCALSPLISSSIMGDSGPTPLRWETCVAQSLWGAGDPGKGCPRRTVVPRDGHRHQTPEPDSLASDPGSPWSGSDCGHHPPGTSASPFVTWDPEGACLVGPAARLRHVRKSKCSVSISSYCVCSRPRRACARARVPVCMCLCPQAVRPASAEARGWV